MKRNVIVVAMCAAAFGAAILISACDHLGTINSIVGGLRYSLEVNNKASRTAISDGDTVELYIETLQYNEDANYRGIILIAKGDRDMGSKGEGLLNNAGWYSVHADLDVKNDVNTGPYSTFMARIPRLRVNGKEYKMHFLDDAQDRWPRTFGGVRYADYCYPDNFSGITVTYKMRSLKTVLTVEPEILECYDTNGDLISDKDPYKYIKVEGIIGEW